MDTGENIIRIGIFGYESEKHGDILGKCEIALRHFTKFAAQHNNVEVFYFCASRVNIVEQTIDGTFYDIVTDTFFQKETSFPNSIYKEPPRGSDLIPMTLPGGESKVLERHADRPTQADKAVHRYIQKTIPSTHVIMGSKLDISRIMEKHCPKYIIQSYDWSEETIDEILEKHKILILKSATASGGRGIYKLSTNEQGLYVLRTADFIREYNKESFFITYSGQFKNENYLVQPFIESVTNDGRPFDVRINVLRGSGGKISGKHREIFIRRGVKDSLVSNLARGGDFIEEWEGFLQDEFGTEQYKVICEEINYISENLLYEVQKGYPDFLLSSAGIDCGINRANGNELKIFEINRSPHINPVWSKHGGNFILENENRFNKRHEVRFNYCLFLAENSRSLKEIVAVEAGKARSGGEAKPETGYIPTKKAIAITFERTDSIDCTFDGLPLPEGTKLAWEITDTSVAKIDESRTISAVGKGETTVNAVLDGEVVTSVPVYVERQPLKPLSNIGPSRFTLSKDGVYIRNSGQDTNKATLMFVGDIMFLSEQQRKAKTQNGSYDFNPSFEYVKPLLELSDFSMGTLETVIDSTYPYKWEQTKVDDGTGYMVPNCNAPVTCLDAVRYGGIDAVSTANNHCLDSGIRGLVSTAEHLDRYNIIRTGTFLENECRYLLIDVNGIKVAILAYTTYMNLMEELWELSPQEKNAYTNHYIEGVTQNTVCKEIREARSRGADFAVVMLHAGLVNTLTPVGKVVRICNEIADAGADYVLGCHTHTLQSYTTVNTADGRKVPVIYSMGNFVSSMDQVEDYRNRDAIILTIELEKQKGQIIMSDGYIPCFSRRKYNDKRYVTLPCDKAYNRGYSNYTLVEAKKRIKATLGEGISKISSKKFEYNT